MVMVLNDTFNNILVISRQSVLLVEETGVPYPEKTTDLLHVTEKLCHIMLYQVHLLDPLSEIRTHNVSSDKH